jgi:hypothetical protein
MLNKFYQAIQKRDENVKTGCQHLFESTGIRIFIDFNIFDMIIVSL